MTENESVQFSDKLNLGTSGSSDYRTPDQQQQKAKCKFFCDVSVVPEKRVTVENSKFSKTTPKGRNSVLDDYTFSNIDIESQNKTQTFQSYFRTANLVQNVDQDSKIDISDDRGTVDSSSNGKNYLKFREPSLKDFSGVKGDKSTHIYLYDTSPHLDPLSRSNRIDKCGEMGKNHLFS